MRGPESGGAGERLPLLEAWHLVVLSAFAVAQPLLGLLGEQASFFVAHGAEASHLVGLALALLLLVPAPLVLARWALGRLWPAEGRGFQALAMALLVALGLLPPLGRALDGRGRGPLLLALALGLGLLAAWLYRRFRAPGTFLGFLSPVVLLFPLLFLLLSPARRLLFLPPGAAAGQSGSGEGPPVLVLVFDELPLPSLLDASGGINPLRYPGFAQLAAGAHWFADATTVAETTVLSLPAIVSGRYPRPGVLPTYLEHRETLFTLLADRYELRSWEPLTNLCPPGPCRRLGRRATWAEKGAAMAADLSVVYAHIVLPADLRAVLPAIDQGWAHFAGEAAESWREGRAKLLAGYLEAVSELGAGELLFLHSTLPHAPWEYLPSGRSYIRGEANARVPGLEERVWSEDPWPALQAYQRYLLQLSFTDRILSAVLERMREVGVFDRALVVVLADHGASFRPGEPRRGVRARTAGEILAVPLMIKLPGQREGVVRRDSAELIDLLPTLADLLEIELPWPVDGRSLFDAEAPERPARRVLAEEEPEPRWEEYPSSLQPQVEAEVRRTIAHFGRTQQDLYRIGPRPELLGLAAAELRRLGASPAAARLARPELYDRVDPASGFLPTLLTGLSLATPERQPRELAVLVGGRVRATTRSVERVPGRWVFSAMLPEAALEPGANRIEIYDLGNPPP